MQNSDSCCKASPIGKFLQTPSQGLNPYFQYELKNKSDTEVEKIYQQKQKEKYQAKEEILKQVNVSLGKEISYPKYESAQMNLSTVSVELGGRIEKQQKEKLMGTYTGANQSKTEIFKSQFETSFVDLFSKRTI